MPQPLSMGGGTHFRRIALVGALLVAGGLSHLRHAPPRAGAAAVPVGTHHRVTPPPSRFGRTVLPRAVRTGPQQIVVRFSPFATARERQQAVSRVDGTVEGTVAKIGATLVDVRDDATIQAAQGLETAPAVQYAEPDPPVSAVGFVTPTDALWPNQWGLKLIGLPQVWGAAPAGGGGPIVAVLDSGVDLTQPDLQGRLTQGIDLVNHDSDPSDDNGHGTAVAGIIAAQLHGGAGGAGVCPSCLIMPVKVLGADGSGDSSTVAAGIVWAVDHGARVINMSLGGPGASQTLADAVAYAMSKAVVLVAAAGNSGSSTPFYPAADPGVVGVAATTSADVLYDWSNRGPWVAVAAPGCNVAPALAGSYENFCGTSSATPVVSGLAGLALQLSPQATATDVAHALETGAPVADVQHGRVDAAALAQALGSAVAAAPPAAPATTVIGVWNARGSVAGARSQRTLPAGPIQFILAGPRAALVSFRVTTAAGRPVVAARVRGSSSLRRTIAAGRYTFTLRAPRGANVSVRMLHLVTAGGA